MIANFADIAISNFFVHCADLDGFEQDKQGEARQGWVKKGEGKWSESKERESKRRVTSKDSLFCFFIIQTCMILS